MINHQGICMNTEQRLPSVSFNFWLEIIIIIHSFNSSRSLSILYELGIYYNFHSHFYSLFVRKVLLNY